MQSGPSTTTVGPTAGAVWASEESRLGRWGGVPSPWGRECLGRPGFLEALLDCGARPLGTLAPGHVIRHLATGRWPRNCESPPPLGPPQPEAVGRSPWASGWRGCF